MDFDPKDLSGMKLGQVVHGSAPDINIDAGHVPVPSQSPSFSLNLDMV